MTCVRFLRARKLDVAKALDMFANYTAWRAEQRVDDVFEAVAATPPAIAEVVADSYPCW